MFLRNGLSPPSQSLTVLTEQLWLFKLQDSKVHLTAYSNNVLPPCTRSLHRRALVQSYRAEDVLLLHRVYFHVVVGHPESDWQACRIVGRQLMHISCLVSTSAEMLNAFFGTIHCRRACWLGAFYAVLWLRKLIIIFNYDIGHVELLFQHLKCNLRMYSSVELQPLSVC